MSKATQSVHRVPTTIGVVRFRRVDRNRIVVSCKGQPKLRIARAAPGAVWEGMTLASLREEETPVTSGKTAELAFKRAIKSFWH